jgi:hypothetical protein
MIRRPRFPACFGERVSRERSCKEFMPCARGSLLGFKIILPNLPILGVVR